MESGQGSLRGVTKIPVESLVLEGLQASIGVGRHPANELGMINVRRWYSLLLWFPLVVAVGCESSDDPNDGSEADGDSGSMDDSSGSAGSHEGSDTSAEGTARVRFLHFNDLHAHLTSHDDLVVSDTGDVTVHQRGSIARLATLVAQQRAEVEHSVLMNIGDTFHGGVEALYTNGNAIVAPVEALGIDLGVPGNWDFAYGPEVTRARFNPDLPSLFPSSFEILGPSYPNLAANIEVTMPASAAGPFLPATYQMSLDGIEVGFIGLSSDIVPEMHELLALGFSFVTGEAAYIDLVESHATELREAGADVVVVMSELGIQKDYRLASQVAPGLVDVVFSAHTHEVTTEPLTISDRDTWVVEAGNDGYLGVMDLKVDRQTNAIVSKDWTLIPIDERIEPDPAMEALVAAARAPFLADDVQLELPSPITGVTLDQPIDTVVGETPFALHRRHPLESPFNNAMTDMQRHIAGTALAMTPGFRFDAVFDPQQETDAVASGTVTLEDVYRFFPVVYTLGVAEVTVDTLREIYEDELTNVLSPHVFEQAGGWVPGFSGLSLEIDLSRADGSRVLSLGLEGQDAVLENDDVLTIAGCRRPFDDDDVLCSHHGFLNVQDMINPQTEAPWSSIDLFIVGLADETWSPRTSIHDQSGTVFWPENPFVQPLEGVETQN